MTRFADVGWTWEGQATDPGVPPSIYGVGEAAEFLGLQRSVFIFHPTTAQGLAKLGDKAEIAVDISKWKWEEVRLSEDFYHVAYHSWRDSRPATAIEEAELLSRLSLQFPNVTAGFIDDTTCMFEYGDYGTQVPEQITAALHSANPALKLWIVVYIQQLRDEQWAPFIDVIDVVHLWCGDPFRLPNLPEHVDACSQAFPGKEIIVGSYLRDYSRQAEVPTEMVQAQYEAMFRLWQEGKIAGYSILANCLIDRHPEQAEWIRDFLSDE